MKMVNKHVLSDNPPAGECRGQKTPPKLEPLPRRLLKTISAETETLEEEEPLVVRRRTVARKQMFKPVWEKWPLAITSLSNDYNCLVTRSKDQDHPERGGELQGVIVCGEDLYGGRPDEHGPLVLVDGRVHEADDFGAVRCQGEGRRHSVVHPRDHAACRMQKTSVFTFALIAIIHILDYY